MTIEEKFGYEANSIEVLPLAEEGEEIVDEKIEHLDSEYLGALGLSIQSIQREFTTMGVAPETTYRTTAVNYGFDKPTLERFSNRYKNMDFTEEYPSESLRISFEQFEAMGRPTKITRTSLFQESN